jgi:hypothetical protein
MNTNKDDVGSRETTSSASQAASGIVNSVDQMVRLPFQMTGMTWDLMVAGMRNMTGTSWRSRRRSSDSETSSSASSAQNGSSLMQNDQDLSGDDLKYVVWSIVFTKPGFECVLEPQHSEIVNYSADGSSFAAVKIAKFLEKARHGHVDKAESWGDHGYPPETGKGAQRRTDVVATESGTTVSSGTSGGAKGSSSQERGWRIPADDQKFITFLYRVEWRLPKQEEVTRVERVTIERGTSRVA